jgi:hypothetical protein
MIYVLTPSARGPTGGVRKLYRHVEVLNKIGHRAVLVHPTDFHRCDWFESDAPVMPWETARHVLDARRDVLMLPEAVAPNWAGPGTGYKKVIFNQGAYQTFMMTNHLDSNPAACALEDVVAMVCVSSDSEAYLRFAFPGIQLHRIRHGIDSRLFRPLVKTPRIAFMPRRNPEHLTQVVQLLRQRNALREMDLLPIENMSETQVGDALGGSAMFLSFSSMEGFGLPPAEAMCAACVVVGYHGNGGREFFKPEHSFPIEYGQIVDYVQTVERVLAIYRDDGIRFMQIGQAARKFIQQNYSMEQEEADIKSAWDAILERFKL